MCYCLVVLREHLSLRRGVSVLWGVVVLSSLLPSACVYTRTRSHLYTFIPVQQSAMGCSSAVAWLAANTNSHSLFTEHSCNRPTREG